MQLLNNHKELAQSNSPTAHSSWVRILSVALFFSFLSILFVNGYSYGIRDHWMIIPYLKDSIHPELYPNDLFIDQKVYYYTAFWPAAVLLHKLIPVNLPYLFFGMYAIALCAIFAGTYSVAMALFQNEDVAVFSSFLLLFFSGHFPPVPVLDHWLMPRFLSTPFLLFAFSSFLKNRWYFAFALLGIAFLIHPINGGYGAILLAAGILVSIRERSDVFRAVKTVLIFLSIAAPMLIWIKLHTPSSLSEFHADPQWIDILSLRNADPLSWDKRRFLQAALKFALFFLAWKYRPEQTKHRVVASFAFAVLALFAINLIFRNLFPLGLVVQLQFFRIFSLFAFFICIYYANVLFSVLREKRSLPVVIGAAFMSGAIFFNLTTRIWPSTAAFCVLSVLILATILRLRPAGSRVTIVLILALAALISIRLPYNFTWNAEEYGGTWTELQHWARVHIATDVMFVVPPGHSGFRVESEHAVYVDWKDGTMAYSNPAFGKEWLRRMRKVGYQPGQDRDQGYRKLREGAFLSLLSETGANTICIVVFRDTLALNFPVLYENKDYRVYQLVKPTDSARISRDAIPNAR